MSGVPVNIHGDANAQLRGIAGLMRHQLSGVDPQPRKLERLALVTNSTRAFEEYIHVSAVPSVRTFSPRERGHGHVKSIKQTIQNETFEVSMAIDVDDFDDDQIGIYDPLARLMANRMNHAPDEAITSQIINNGETILSYDSVAFYATTHKWPEGDQAAQSNLQTGSGVDATDIETDFYTAKNAIQVWKDDKGELMFNQDDVNNPDNWIVHHGPNLNQAMKVVFGQAAGGGSFDIPEGSNGAQRASTLTGAAQPMSDGYITDNDWYCHFVGGVEGANKPFAFLNRSETEIQIFGKGSEHTSQHNEILILAKRRFGLGVHSHERSQKINN